MRRNTLASLLLVALCVSSTLAWGPVGHAVVATIAQNLISPKTWQAVQTINGFGKSMADVASQPDAYDHTSNGKWSSPLHYVNMPAGATRFTDDSADCTNQFCVVGAIKNYTLQSQKLPMSQWPYDGDSSQPSPITFLIHFTGDCHQPLHVGWKSDLGGNTVHCTFFGRKSELHQVWDSGMIYHSGYNTTGLSALLLNWIAQNPSTVANWRSQASVSAWADESFQYVRTTVYNFGSAAGNMELGTQYYNANWPIVQQRLAMAGVRLAALLDSIFH
jgi:hypothetical protein